MGYTILVCHALEKNKWLSRKGSNMIRFMKHYVTDGKTKARVYYCGNHRIGGVPCVTLYAKD